MWADEDFLSETEVEPVTKDALEGSPPQALSADYALFAAIDWLTKRSGFPVLAQRDKTEDVYLLSLGARYRPDRSGSLGQTRIPEESDPATYCWIGDERLANPKRLHEKSRVTDVSQVPPGFNEVSTRPWAKIRPPGDVTAVVRLFVAGPGVVESAPPDKEWKKLNGQRFRRKRRKGRTPEDQPGKNEGGAASPGVKVGWVTPRKDAQSVMGKSAAEAAELAGPPVAGEPYEWCHLVGHGEGGAENAGNLVAATKSANTEQLAIEEGFRKARLSAAFRRKRKSDGIDLLLKVTAYTIPGHNDVALWIRYRIVDQASNVVIDYRIDGRAKGFTRPQFYAMRENVRWALLTHFGIDPYGPQPQAQATPPQQSGGPPLSK